MNKIIGQTYYNRTMRPELVNRVQTEFPWLIDYVKNREDLDFQTGHDPRSGKSWFSIYRGTGRVMTIDSVKGKIKAADAYKDIAPIGFFEHPTSEGMDGYLDKINEASAKFGRYYAAGNGEKKEGYFQNLISRRYTFNAQPQDDFIIIDKEFVIGFSSNVVKDEWNKSIEDELKGLITQMRKDYERRLPKDIKTSYGEFDFLGLNWNGDLLIMELKQDDPAKTALSPIQTGFYYRQLQKLLDENGEDWFYDSVKKMIEQKAQLGILKIPEGRSIPDHLSGTIKTCVIVGDDSFSKEIVNRFRFMRKYISSQLDAYTCESDGTLKKSMLD